MGRIFLYFYIKRYLRTGLRAKWYGIISFADIGQSAFVDMEEPVPSAEGISYAQGHWA